MINQFTRLFSMLTTAIALPNKQVLPTFYKRNLPIALLIGGMLGLSATTAWGWGGGGTSGWGSYSASRIECPYGGFPTEVVNAVIDDFETYPLGVAGIRFAVNLNCFEQDGTSCEDHTGENGIRTILYADLLGDNAGFQIFASDNSITRTGGGSFITDGFEIDMKIGIRTSLNGPATADLNELTIASVTGTRIVVVEDVLQDEGLGGIGAPGKIFSSRVHALTDGFTGCYSTDDDGDFLIESPLPVDQASVNIDYQNVIRECDETELTCTWTALVTDASHSINGYLKLDDGEQFVNHGCVAGEPCSNCVRNPDTLNKKTSEHYKATLFFGTLESVHAIEDASATPPLIFDSRTPSTGMEIGDETACAAADAVFTEKGKARAATAGFGGFVVISGHSESQNLNIANTSGTLKYTFSPGSKFACADIDPATIRLENAIPIPGSELEILGNLDCRSQFYRGEVIANIRASNPGIADGDTFTLVAKGEYDKANDNGFTPSEYCSTEPCDVFGSSDTVGIIEQYSETIAFSTTNSEVLEPDSGTITHSITVQVAGGSLNGVVTVDVVDTLNGSANKKDYEFASNPTTLIFDPSDSGSLTQTVELTILANSPNNEVDTVILQLVNKTGPADLGSITQHTVTIND